MSDWAEKYLQEREDRYRMLQALVAMLYLRYKEEIRLHSLKIENTPEPYVYLKVREIVDQEIPFYHGLSKSQFVAKFQTIVGNGKELLDIPPAYFGEHHANFGPDQNRSRRLQSLQVIEDKTEDSLRSGES